MLDLFIAKHLILPDSIFQISAPIPQGVFFAGQQLVLCTSGGQVVPCAFTVVSLWDDQSIKWLNVLGKFDNEYEENTQFHLKPNSNKQQIKRRDWVFHHDNFIVIETNHGQVSLSKNICP